MDDQLLQSAIELIAQGGIIAILLIWLQDIRKQKNDLREAHDKLEAEFREYLKGKVTELERETRPLRDDTIKRAIASYEREKALRRVDDDVYQT